MRKHVITILFLLLLQLLVDTIFVFIYPEVNPLRALFIGMSSSVLLLPVPFISMWKGGASIFSSALFGALLVQNGIMVSKSLLSGVVHTGILIATYAVIESFKSVSHKNS